MRTLKSKLQFLARCRDEIPAVRAGHIVLIVLAAALLNLGAFAMLILGHMALDLTKHRDGKTGWRVALRNTWHDNIVDVALLVISFTVALYFHHTGGIVAISGVMRADVFILQALVVYLPKAEILCKSVHMLRDIQRRMATSFPLQLTPGRTFATATIAVCVMFLLVAPIVLQMRAGSLTAFVDQQLVPWHF